MTDPTTPAAELAERAADAVRDLNHNTYGAGMLGWCHPGDAYDTVGQLAALSRRLPQTFAQVTTLVTALQDAGHLSTSNGTPGEHVTATARALANATAASRFMTDALDAAHAALSPLGYAD